MLSGLYSLRSAPNEMHSLFSASSGQSTKYLARFSTHRRSAAIALTRCYALRPWSHVVGSFHLRFVAPMVAVARLPISLLLALRAAVLRLAVSPLVLSSSSVLLLRLPTAPRRTSR
jgi:hypothetical protein